MSYKQELCLSCSLPGANNSLGLCDKCRSEIVESGGFSTVKITRLYGISKGQLKKLKKSNELTPIKLENGNWQFPIEDIEQYLAKNPQRLKNIKGLEAEKPEVEKNISADVSIISDKDVMLPEANNFYDFDVKPREDIELVSKANACSAFNLSSSQFDELLKNHTIYKTKKGRNRLYNKLQILEAIDSSSLKNGKWSHRFTKCRECATISTPHYASGYCVKCYPETLEYLVLKEYLTGKTFADIGRENGISRERARQLFEKAVINETENVVDTDSDNNKDDILSIREVIKEEARKNGYRRRCKDDIVKSLDKMDEIIKTTSTSSPKVLLTRVGISAGASFIIDEDYPEISRRLFMNGNRWSTQHDKCVLCGSTEHTHRSNGMCEMCYRKSDTHKAMQSKWRANNYEKIRTAQKKYEQEYYQRPEVKERLKKQGYQRRFGSQIRRDTAIKQYGNKCSDCGISRSDHNRINNQDLSVIHMDGNLQNNDLDNLKPFCMSCSAKMARKINLGNS